MKTEIGKIFCSYDESPCVKHPNLRICLTNKFCKYCSIENMDD